MAYLFIKEEGGWEEDDWEPSLFILVLEVAKTMLGLGF